MPAENEDAYQDGQLVRLGDITTEEDRAYQAFLLRQQGVPAEMVAQQVGYANGQTVIVSVQGYLQKAAMDLSRERREEALTMSVLRIEELYRIQRLKADMGDTKAAEFCLRAVMNLAKLQGADTLHEQQGQTTKTIVVTGADMAETLKQIAED